MTDKPFPWMTNRRVAAMNPEFLGTWKRSQKPLAHRWVVCDRYSPKTGDASDRGKAMTYGCEAMLLTLMDDHMGWVIVNDRGQFLRTNGWTGDARHIRRFKTVQAAAACAEAIPMFNRYPDLTVAEARALNRADPQLAGLSF